MLRGIKQLNLPELEKKVLAFWREHNIFEKSLALRQAQDKRQKSFIFYEGPPSANARPGTHHVLVRIFKDIICRYKTMRGFFVPRQAGWDTQGLPIELQVEKELGLKQKSDIEAMGIAQFNQRAKDLVWKYKDEWEKLTERIGFWLDTKNAYVTYKNEYLEKLWQFFKQAEKRKLLYKSNKVVPWCWRCGTVLSSHELAQGYKTVIDTSVYVRFKLLPKQKIGDWETNDQTYIVSWTTTPWTLPGNVALAVGDKIEYALVESDGAQHPKGLYILAKGEKTAAAKKTFTGKELIGLHYEPLFNIQKLKNKQSHRIYAANFVNTNEGTGVVHTAVMYGDDDYQLGVRVGLPQYHTVTPEGRFTNEVPDLAGLLVKNTETENKIIELLKSKGFIFDMRPYEHEYPFCWRCQKPLIYFAHQSWFIGMSKLRKQLLNANETINWIPEHLKHGRFGEWLREVKDWAISRERYWGTPLPIWECNKLDVGNGGLEIGKKSCDGRLVVGSLADLDKHAYHRNEFYIMRNGEGTHNIGDWISGDKETDKKAELTEKGIVQVEEAAKKLAKKKIDIVYCSPFHRTKQTAAIVKKHTKAELIYDARIAELNCGMFNGKSVSEYTSSFRNETDRFTNAPLNGESLRDVRRRVLTFITDINQRHVGKRILIISHGDPLWMMETGLMGLDIEKSDAWQNEHYLAVGAPRAMEYHNWSRAEDGELDLHRPYIDDIILRCPKCKGSARRVKEVADVWLDSGAMPFAVGEYPDRYPADYICEAMDQTRGWFYTLLAVSAVMGEGAPYKHVISLGHLLDKQGQKMSKSKGNVVDPWEMINKYGVDVLRWYFYTINPPGESKKFNEQDLPKVRRRLHDLVFNSYVFWETYSNYQLLKSDIDSALSMSDFGKFNILDRWILAHLHETTAAVTKKLDDYDIGEAAKTIESFVDDLSRWYIRRSRKRPEALPVLREVLLALSKLIAPFTPFFAEVLFQSLEVELPSEGRLPHIASVHLCDFPVADKKLIDKKIIEQMAEVRRVASLALAKRAEFKIPIRQPLASLKIKNQKSKIKNHSELLNVLKDEINVKEIIFDISIVNEVELDTAITPALKQEGIAREMMRLVQDLRKKAKYQPSDEIVLWIETPESLRGVVDQLERHKKELHIREVQQKRTDKFDAELRIKLGGADIWLGVQR